MRLARQLWFQVLVAMAAGAALGYARPDLGARMQPLGDAFVNLVYQNVLGRAPDQGGHDYWLGLLNSGQITRAGMMSGFIDSPEFSSNVRARAFANLLYMGFLRRTAEPAGLAFWTGILADPNQLPNAISGFINGPEYMARFQ